MARSILPIAELKVERYPVRTCRTLHECAGCGGPIVAGQRYRDGGYERRIHEDAKDCVWLRASRTEAPTGEEDRDG